MALRLGAGRLPAAVRAALAGGIAGNVAISLYLSLALPVFFATAPVLLFQWDASNIVGSWAYRHGLASAALGLFFDFIVSWCWAAVYTVLYVRIPAVARATALSGLLFGVVVMLAMFYLVVPLGHARHPSSDPRALLNALIAHTAFFGLPLALTVRWSFGNGGIRKGIGTPAH